MIILKTAILKISLVIKSSFTKKNKYFFGS